MLRLYDNQERLIKIVHADSIKSLEQKQILSDQYVSDYLTAELLAIDEQVLKDVEYMAIPYRDDPRKYHLYYLANDTLERNNLVLEGVQSGIEELRKHPIYDQRSYQLDLGTTASKLLEGTNWQVGFVGGFDDVNTNFYYMSAFDALKKACKNVGAEMQFFVEVTPTGIGARYIDFKKKIGNDSGRRVVYGHNALKIIKETNKTDLYTAIIPRGKGLSLNGEDPFVEYEQGYTGPLVKSVDVSEGPKVNVNFFKSSEKEVSPIWQWSSYYTDNQKDLAYITVAKNGQVSIKKVNLNSDGEGYTRKLGINNVRWSKSKGDPIDKPLGERALIDKNATALYGIKNADGGSRPKYGFFDAGDETDPYRLMELGYRSLMELNRPALVMKTDSLYLPGAGIGDTVRVVRPDKNFDYKTRVFEITWDRLTNATNSMKLGDKSSVTDGTKHIESLVNNAISDFDSHINGKLKEVVTQIPSANGFNRNNYTSAEPKNPKIGDLWFKPDPEREGEHIILRWNGEMWEKLMSKDFSKELEAKFKEQEEKDAELGRLITEAEAKADQAVKDAGFNVLDDAKRYAESEALKRYRESVEEAKRLDTLLSSSNKSYVDKKVTDTVSELKTEYIDVKLGDYVKTATYTQGIDGLSSVVSNIKTNPGDNISGWNNLANKSYVSSYLNQKSDSIEQGVKNYVNSNTYKESVAKYTADSINQSISRITGGKVTGLNQLTNTVNGMEQIVSSPDSMARQIMTSRLFQSEVKNYVPVPSESQILAIANRTKLTKSEIRAMFRDGFINDADMRKIKELSGLSEDEVNDLIRANNSTMSTRINQMGDNIDLALFGQRGAISRINAGYKGIYIKGENIRFDGTVRMDDAFVNNIYAKMVEADSFKANSAVIANAIVDKLDVNKMSGFTATWIENVFNGVYSRLKVTGDGISIVDNYGRSSISLGLTGLHFYEKGYKLGTFEYALGIETGGRNGVVYYPERNADFSFGYKDPNRQAIQSSVIYSGDTGDIYVTNKIHGYSNSKLGFYIREINILGEQAVGLQNERNTAGIYFTNSGKLYLVDSRGAIDLQRIEFR